MAEDSKPNEGKGLESNNAAPGSHQDKGKVVSGTPENALGRLNPSAPGDTGNTPGSNAQ
jgi:hypothetical protein